MIWFKKCPRCTGDLCQDADLFIPSIFCLQCGYRSYTEAGSQRLLTDLRSAVQVTSIDPGEHQNTQGRGPRIRRETVKMGAATTR